MTSQILLFLGQDGLVNGAIYVLMALALVLVFSVTRIILIQQGEFLAFSALSLAAIQSGSVPGTVWLLIGAGWASAAADLAAARRAGRSAGLKAALGWNLAYPPILAAVLWALPLSLLPVPLQAALALALVVPLGPMMYRLAYRPLEGSPVLVLLIVSVAMHFVLVGFSLLFFGADGARAEPFTRASYRVFGTIVSGQSIITVVASLVMVTGLFLFFERTIQGKALRATAINPVGARLMGISTRRAGRLSFLLAALIGALSGILIAPTTIVYYDTGFLVALKGFVGAILGGLVSYPLAAAGALSVGFVEAYASFAASAFKEVIVFTLVIPALLWRSLSAGHAKDDQ